MTTTEKRHSPGPWKFCAADGDGCSCGLVWSTPRDLPIAEALLGCEEEGVKYPVAEVRANARLIAAAPDLLEAANAVLNRYMPAFKDSREVDDELVALADAVFKAEGQS